jgi:hypothetical protein
MRLNTHRINELRLAVSVLAVLVAAPLIRSQDMKPSEAKVLVAQRLAVQELRLQPRHGFGGWLQAAPVSAPAMGTPNLSRYRDFQFGETLPTLAKRVGLKLSGAKLIHESPAVLQELEWQPRLSRGSSAQTDPVKTILFSFYNGELFRIVVDFDRDETEGMTAEDMIKAISAKYGTANRPATTAIVFSSTQVYNDSEVIIARWEDSQYSLNLYRSTYQSRFGMIAFSKRVDALARAATAEAIRLDVQEALP